MQKVLFVDDNPDMIGAYRELFELEGYEVYTASAANESMQLVSDIRPDIVFLDGHLAHESGAVILEYVQGHAQLKNTRTIILTGDIDLREKDARYLTADGFLVKPVDLTTMLETLHSVSVKSTQLAL